MAPEPVAAQANARLSSIDLDEFRFDWAVLPSITEACPGTGGTLRTCVDDFVVSEIPRDVPSGQGEFAYAYVEKRGLNTHDLLAAIREHGVSYDAIGVAGLKDKNAVTRQWLSVPAENAAALEAVDALKGARVLETSRHDTRIRRGHLRGNRFEVRVRKPAEGWQERARCILDRLQSAGLPNYFGPQRFGRFNSNAIDAVRLLCGERVPGGRRLNDFFISALQGHLFNWYLKLRIETGLYDRVVEGDRARRHDTGGMFVVGDGTAESERAARLEISAVLPLYGRKVAGGLEQAAKLEEQIFGRFCLRRSDFRPLNRGAWRISRVIPTDMELEPDPSGYRVSFTLPNGSYATCFLRELTKTDVDVMAPS